MRRLKLFLSRFLLSLWIVLFGSFLFLLVFESRGGGINTPFAGISINAVDSDKVVHLPNRIFTCIETQQQCQAEIQGRSLKIALKEIDQSGSSTCRAEYGGQPVSCDAKGMDFAPRLSESFEVTGLGLSPRELQAVRRRYWGVSTLLTLGEPRLMQIGLWLSVATGVVAAYFAWFYPSRLTKSLASAAWGFIAYRWVWLLLASMPSRNVTPAQGLIVEAGSLIAGIVVMVLAALLIWRRESRVVKAVITLSSGGGSILMAGYLFVVLLLWSGFAD